MKGAWRLARANPYENTTRCCFGSFWNVEFGGSVFWLSVTIISAHKQRPCPSAHNCCLLLSPGVPPMPEPALLTSSPPHNSKIRRVPTTTDVVGITQGQGFWITKCYQFMVCSIAQGLEHSRIAGAQSIGCITAVTPVLLKGDI